MKKEISIEVKNLTKHFGGVIALENVDAHIFYGEILGLIGPNGAGKTTLINLITGLYPPTRGDIFWEGDRVKNWSLVEAVKQGIVRTFQHNKIFPELTVGENILVGQHIYRVGGLKKTFSKKLQGRNLNIEAEKILQFLNLKEQRNAIAKRLPYGSMRRLGIGIALAANPKVLLLDEPAVGMTPDDTKTLMDIIRQINSSGVTICLVDHNMKFLMGISHRVMVLNQGFKIAEGTAEEIQKNEEVIRIYLRGTKKGA
jgi:branched-chain amino acid transport system ATP-binding protein